MAGEAELVDAEAEEEKDAGDVGFGFGDGYDFGAGGKAGLAKGIFKGVSGEARAVSAVETDAVEVGIEAGIVGEDDTAVVGAVAHRGVVLVHPIPVPDGEVGAGCPGANAAEAQDAGESVQIDDGVGAEREEADILVEISTHSECAATEVDVCIAVHSIGDCDEEGTGGDLSQGRLSATC